MKIATSPFVYWGVSVFMPEKLGNLQSIEIQVYWLYVFALARDHETAAAPKMRGM